MLTKGEQLALAFILFGLAILFLGIKQASVYEAYRIAKYFTFAIKQTLEFADKNYPATEPFFSVNFSLDNNRDTFYIDRLHKRITSKKNFTYEYRGYKVVCSVSYDPKNRYYVISCEAK